MSRKVFRYRNRRTVCLSDVDGKTSRSCQTVLVRQPATVLPRGLIGSRIPHESISAGVVEHLFSHLRRRSPRILQPDSLSILCAKRPASPLFISVVPAQPYEALPWFLCSFATIRWPFARAGPSTGGNFRSQSDKRLSLSLRGTC